jgi:hypothetical protein
MDEQENNLEKEARIVGAFEDFIISELAPYVPFSFMSKAIMGNWIGEGKSFRKGFSRRMGSNLLVCSLVSAAVIFYSISSLTMGTPNYKGWSGISKQKELQREQETRDYSNSRFREADKNGDLVLDSDEFYDCVYGQRVR